VNADVYTPEIFARNEQLITGVLFALQSYANNQKFMLRLFALCDVTTRSRENAMHGIVETQ
jgi:hypothetical protein